MGPPTETSTSTGRHWMPILLIAAVLASYLVRRAAAVPRKLAHLPRVPVWSLIWSFATGEVEEQRIKRLLLPFANVNGEGIVVVWALGRWMVHILDYKLAKTAFENRSLTKQLPPEEMLLWRFTGRSNVFLTEGEQWKKHSRIVRAALQRPPPIEQFAALSNKLFLKLGEGGRVRWNDLTHRFTLDAVGTTILGYDFHALDNPGSPFVVEYHAVMSAIANPAYIAIPSLERWLPRRSVIRKMDLLVDRFRALLEEKKQNRGNDMITFMLEEPGMTDEEYRDNVIVFFMGGHDTTAGALSSLIYFFAKYPEIQKKARREVIRVLGSDDPTMDTLARMQYLQACIRESMRLNNPSTVTIPRVSSQDIKLGPYTILANTPIVLDMCAILHNESSWPDHREFQPSRFLDNGAGESGPWIPFGLGARQCPARNFALYEQRTLASMLLRAYEWSLPQDTIHEEHIQNAFSPFALSLPYNMDIVFRKI